MQFKRTQESSSLTGLCSHFSIAITRNDVDKHKEHDVDHINTH
jgi:hypothetical protein